MFNIQTSAHRPLIGAVAALLLVSACSAAAESASDPTTTPPTAPAPTTAPPTTASVPDPAPIDAVDVSGGTVFGISVFDAVDVDAVGEAVSAQLGAPTSDSGWQPQDGPTCAGSTDARVLWWGDFRMTFERYQDDDAVRDELSAWTVGDPTLFQFAPIGDVPTPTPSNLVTLEGIGLHSTVADLEQTWQNVNGGGSDVRVVIDRGGVLTLRIDNDDQVIGFGAGPFDCPVDELR